MPGNTRAAVRGCARVFPFLCVGLLFVCACGGCKGKEAPPDYSLMEQAETHIQKLDWDSACPLIRRYLLQDPTNNRAHFQLGRCYLNGSTPFPRMAEGEFYVTLKLFTEQGKKSPFPEFTDSYYELRCHIEVVKTYLLRLQWAEASGAPEESVTMILGALRDKLEIARSVDPTSGDVKEMEKTIDAIYGKAVPPRENTTPKTMPTGNALSV